MITHLQKQTRELKAIAERMQRENIRLQKLKEKTVNSHERTGTGHIKIRVRRKIVQTGRTL